MDMPTTQTRQTTLKIDLGGEHVLLERIQGVEALGKPFQLALDIIAPLGEVDIFPHLGKPTTVFVMEDDELLRYFHGLVTEGEFLRESSEGVHYRLTLRPWTYYLSQNRNFAIFQDLDTIDIVKKVLSDAGVSDVDYGRLSGNFTKRDYCVQYGESDFAFISRLMEEDGIYYFFQHEQERHVMVLCNAPASHREANPSRLAFNAESRSVFNAPSAKRITSAAREHHVNSWVERVTSGGESKVTLRDFDFHNPERPIEATVTDRRGHPKDSQEVYAYPAGYVRETISKGGTAGLKQLRDTLGATALAALRAERKLYTGQSQASGLACGRKVQVQDHPHGRFNRTYLITETLHSITAETYRTGQHEDEDDFNVEFEAIPDDTTWRPLRVSPRPVVHGLESAIVAGPQGEEIYTDEYGRVKVRFHWDRSNNPGDKSTCWIRVSQTGGLGNIIIPRVGHEVLIDFLGGDPDRPVVVGRVFNKSHMPIYPLPEHKTRALWRTKRYGEAGQYPNAKPLDVDPTGANELRFEDKGGSEEVFLYAERDMNTRIRHNETHHVGTDQTNDIGHNRTERVGKEEDVTVGGNRKVLIKKNDDLDVKGSINIKAGTTIEIEAGVSITLKVGGTTVKLDATGVQMKGPMLSASADAMAEIKSPMTTIKGDGILTLKGGMTMIN
jgi:type VI secretion system secreted protein VgrG